MLNLNAIPNPYDNIRPKGFFSARKNQMIEKILISNRGMSVNRSYKVNKTITRNLPKGYDASWEEMKFLLPWMLFLGMTLINLLFWLN